MTIEIETATHYGIGPYIDVGDHGPVTVFVPPGQKALQFAACLDCGLVAPDLRRYHVTECERDSCPIAQTWRELIDCDGFPE